MASRDEKRSCGAGPAGGAGVKRVSLAFRRIRGAEKGFTMVELLIVMVVSVVLIAGMIGLVEMAMGQLTRSRALAAVTDSARRALASMDRQIKQALYIVDDGCSSAQLTFYGDIDSDNPDADILGSNHLNAERVRFYRDEGENTLVEEITQPSSEGSAVSYNTLCSYVTGVRFYYFPRGVTPVYDAGSGTYTNGMSGDYNAECGMIKVVVDFQRSKISRKFEQDIFLRILNRVKE